MELLTDAYIEMSRHPLGVIPLDDAFSSNRLFLMCRMCHI